MLPGVAYLEMARAAVEAAAGTLAEGTGIRLKNVVWIRPVKVDEQPVQIQIGLFPEANGEIDYEIFSEGAHKRDHGEPVVHSQGKAVCKLITEIPFIELAAMQAQCTQRTIAGTEMYDAFKAMGLELWTGTSRN